MGINVLVVDDQVSVVDGIVSGVNWDACGVSHVYTAFSAEEAKDIFSLHKIALALCDIEMPSENGVDLVTWIKNYYPETETVFLTSHAEFSYAQMAVKLQCYDYLVQPVRYDELQNCIQGALLKLKKMYESHEDNVYGEYWQNHKEILQRNFLYNIVFARRDFSEDVLIRRGDEISLNFDSEERWILVYLALNTSKMPIMHWEEGAFEIYQDTRDGLLPHMSKYFEIRADESHVAVLIDSASGQSVETIQNEYKLFVELCKIKYSFYWAVYVSDPVSIGHVKAESDVLMSMEKENVAFVSDVFVKGEMSGGSQDGNSGLGEDWVILFSSGFGQKVYAEIRQTMEQWLKENKLTRGNLAKVFRQVTSSYFASLGNRGIDCQQLLEDPEYTRIYQQAGQGMSVGDLYRYIQYLVTWDQSHRHDRQEEISLVDQIKNYIRDHIDQDLNRDKISNEFFISKDHISHLFKDETGMALIDYINKEKINRAKTLLIETNMSVSLIAVETGFVNFSYFSRLFKKYVGCSPNEYRKNLMKPG